MATSLEEQISALEFSDDPDLNAVGRKAAAAKFAVLPGAAKSARGTRAGKKTSNAGHVQTTTEQRNALAKKVETSCAVAGAVAVAAENLELKKK
jgi:hypothetical protein